MSERESLIAARRWVEHFDSPGGDPGQVGPRYGTLEEQANMAREVLELSSELERQQEMWSMQSQVIRALAAEVPDEVRARILAPLRGQVSLASPAIRENSIGIGSITAPGASLFSTVRLGLIQHSETDKDAALAALSNIYLLMGSLASYAMAAPTNEASRRARDNAIARAKEAMGIG